MLGRAIAGGSETVGIGFALDQGDERLEIFRRHRRMNLKHHRQRRDLDDGREVLERIVGQGFVEGHIDRHRAARREQYGIAVRRGLGHRVAANIAAGPGLVLDDHRNAELDLQGRLEQTRHQIGDAARRIRHHELDRVRRIDIGSQRRAADTLHGKRRSRQPLLQHGHPLCTPLSASEILAPGEGHPRLALHSQPATEALRRRLGFPSARGPESGHGCHACPRRY